MEYFLGVDDDDTRGRSPLHIGTFVYRVMRG